MQLYFCLRYVKLSFTIFNLVFSQIVIFIVELFIASKYQHFPALLFSCVIFNFGSFFSCLLYASADTGKLMKQENCEYASMDFSNMSYLFSKQFMSSVRQ